MAKVKCELCGNKYTAEGGILRHLKSCLKSRDVHSKSSYLMLKVSDTDNADYFLYLLIHENETLCTLDIYMKAIWLECCGHLSQFYTNPFSPEYARINNTEYHGPIRKILKEGERIHYDYDFGSTTTLEIECIKDLVECDRDEPIVLLARNENPFKNKDNSPRAGVCSYKEDVNYRMMFLKQYGDYRSDRKDLEAYTCHLNGNDEDIDYLTSDNVIDEIEAVDEVEAVDEIEVAALKYEDHIKSLTNKYRKQISPDITLEEALKRLNKKAIVAICRSYSLLPYSTQSKAILVNRLVNELPGIFRDNLSMLDHNQLEMYNHFKGNREVLKEDIDIMSNHNLFFLESTIRHFIWFGTDAEDEFVFVIPKELKEVLNKADLKVLKLRAQSNTKIVTYAKGLLNIYGLLMKEELYDFLQSYLGLSMDREEVFNIVSNACHFYSDISDFGRYYTWREMNDALEIIEERAIEDEMSWKALTADEIEKAGDEFYYPDIDSFRLLETLIIKYTPIPIEGINFILNSVFELTTRFTDPEIIIAYMAEIFNVESLSREEEIEIINCLEDLYYSCGMRVYKGNSLRDLD